MKNLIFVVSLFASMHCLSQTRNRDTVYLGGYAGFDSVVNGNIYRTARISYQYKAFENTWHYWFEEWVVLTKNGKTIFLRKISGYGEK